MVHEYDDVAEDEDKSDGDDSENAKANCKPTRKAPPVPKNKEKTEEAENEETGKDNPDVIEVVDKIEEEDKKVNEVSNGQEKKSNHGYEEIAMSEVTSEVRHLLIEF